MRKIVPYILFVVLLTGCQYFGRKHQVGVVAELNGNFIYENEVRPLVVGLDSVDSARVMDAYIRQWAIDILVYDEARDRADKTIESLVEDYRRSLYVHAYEEQLVAQRMPKRVSQDVVEEFYEQHKENFVLDESIVRGLLLVIPNDAPKMNDLRKFLQTINEENVEKIEKYAYSYATGYEYFVEDWKTANHLLVNMPFEQNNLAQQLLQKNQIELQDSISTYILRVTDKRLAGDLMPIEYAAPEIEKVILSQRQVAFLQSEREKLYQKAVQRQQLKVQQ